MSAPTNAAIVEADALCYKYTGRTQDCKALAAYVEILAFEVPHDGRSGQVEVAGACVEDPALVDGLLGQPRYTHTGIEIRIVGAIAAQRTVLFMGTVSTQASLLTYALPPGETYDRISVEARMTLDGYTGADMASFFALLWPSGSPNLVLNATAVARLEREGG